ncbi:concanavalin A-like lectin/glucanase domain-containing protein [Mycena leptocephala]|nr:concanavalin A-like lectin/glucanase domain-containing protein [Mycena leptocephala]
MSRPAPLSFLPPNPPFASNNANGSGSDNSEPPSPTAGTHSRGHSPPVTPRSLSFLTPPVTRDGGPNPFFAASSSSTSMPGTPPNGPAQPPQNPFSPPASVRSFSASFSSPPPLGSPPLPADSPSGHHNNASVGSTGYPFPSPGSTRASSLVDMPRAFSTYSFGGGGDRGSFSRPSTSGSLRPGSASTGIHPASSPLGNTTGTDGRPAKREAFASPPARPLTIYAAPSTARLRRERPKSTAILVPSALVYEDGDPKRPKVTASTRPTLTGTLSKPWVGMRDPHSRFAYWITYGVVLLGIAAGAARAYLGWTGVLILQDNLCPVLLEDFSNTDTASLFGSGVAGEGGKFFREVDASGFGNGEFEMTTPFDTNSFVHNGQLYLVPTLTSDMLPIGNIMDGAVYNLTGCTYNITHSSGYTTSGHGAAGINTTEGEVPGGGGIVRESFEGGRWCLPEMRRARMSGVGAAPRVVTPDAPLDLPAYLAACSVISNATEGKIFPPVMSARISTRKTASVKFGRVEVVAKLPTGDWLWPAIWMLPVDSVYGGWPLSGEIDIMEARGNGPSYPKQGINYVRSSLNWGPATFLNAVAKTYGWWTTRRGRYDEGFHTYALEWNEEFMRMYVDSRLTHMFELKLKKSFWELGDFPTVVQNGSESVVLENPWVNGTKAAPFDQPFYLIMNVAVGGTNGWFPDGPEKPWLDGSGTAPLDFLRAQNQWYPTWPQDISKRAMVVDSVKMWEKC